MKLITIENLSEAKMTFLNTIGGEGERPMLNKYSF